MGRDYQQYANGNKELQFPFLVEDSKNSDSKSVQQQLNPNIKFSRSSSGSSSGPSESTKKVTVQQKIVSTATSQDCFQQLKQFRNQLMHEHRLDNPSSIFTDSQLWELSNKLATTKQAFLKATGCGEDRYKEFGEGIIKIIRKINAKEKQSPHFKPKLTMVQSMKDFM